MSVPASAHIGVSSQPSPSSPIEPAPAEAGRGSLEEQRRARLALLDAEVTGPALVLAPEQRRDDADERQPHDAHRAASERHPVGPGGEPRRETGHRQVETRARARDEGEGRAHEHHGDDRRLPGGRARPLEERERRDPVRPDAGDRDAARIGRCEQDAERDQRRQRGEREPGPGRATREQPGR